VNDGFAWSLSIWRAKPRTVAQRLSEETGVRVFAASDGMRFDLAGLGMGG
jgi:hypothetical protein